MRSGGMLMQRSRMLRWGALFLVLITLVLDDVMARFFDAYREVTSPPLAHAALLVPAPFTLLVALPLYGLLLGYLVWQLLPAQRRLRPCDRLSESILVMSFLSTGWMIALEVGSGVLCVLVLLAMIAMAWTMALRARVAAEWGAFPRWCAVPFSLLLGWLLVATLANVGAALAAFGLPPSPVVAAMMLAALAVGSITTGLSHRDPVIPLAMSWGAFGIAVADWEKDILVSSLAASAASAGVVAALLLAARAWTWPAAARRAAPKLPRVFASRA